MCRAAIAHGQSALEIVAFSMRSGRVPSPARFQEAASQERGAYAVSLVSRAWRKPVLARIRNIVR